MGRYLLLLLALASAAFVDHNARVARALSSGDELSLLAALGERGRALVALLKARDVSSALALARGAPRAPCASCSPAARALQQDAWASATVDVSTLRGVPLPGNTVPPRLVYLTFPDGRYVRVHPASVDFAGLPTAGTVPVQGFFFGNMFVADRDGAECGAPGLGGGRGVECVVGGEALAFASPAAAEREVAARRRAGARGLQMGADPAIAPTQPYFDPALTKGARSVLLLNVKFRNQPDNSVKLCTMAQVYNGSASLIKYHGERSFGAVTITTKVVNCVLELSKTSEAGYASGDAMMDDALAKAAITTPGCGAALTAAEIAAFNHRVVYHPLTLADPFDYHGLGSMSGCVSSRAHDALQSFPTRAHAHPPRAILTPRYASRATPPHTHTHFSGKTCG